MTDASSLMGFRPLVATGMGRRAAMQLADAETSIPPSISPLVATGMGRRAAMQLADAETSIPPSISPLVATGMGRRAAMQLADAGTGNTSSIFSDLEKVMANAGREDVFRFVFRNQEMLAQEALKNPAKAAMLYGILGSKAYQIFESGVLQSMNEADSSAAETPSRSGGIPSLVAPINQSGY